MKPTKNGQIAKFHSPLPNEDPDQLYVILDIHEDVERPRAKIQALNTNLPFPPISTVLLEDLMLESVSINDLNGLVVKIITPDGSIIIGKVLDAKDEAVDLNMDLNNKFVQTNLSLKVIDKDDAQAGSDLASLVVSAEYMEGSDRAASSQGHQVLTEAMIGRNTMLALDCKSCHKTDEKSVGPAYTAVAKKYEKTADADKYLVEKIIKGGGGVWGEVAMPAHPTLKEGDARQIVTWIRSLAGSKAEGKSLPPTGTVNPTLNKPVMDRGMLYLSASYTDKGGTNIKPLTGDAVVVLRNNKMAFGSVKTMTGGYSKFNLNGMALLLVPKSNGSFVIDEIDLTDVNGITLNAGWREPPTHGFAFEIKLDDANGKVLGQINMPAGGAKGSETKPAGASLKTKIEPVTDGKKHKLFITSKPLDPKEESTVALQSLQLNQ
ncbi:MAG: c-type cytochrome [Flavobacterium sp.]|nr:MAG: c-type cytochrome [Flavobacterium sp.]